MGRTRRLCTIVRRWKDERMNGWSVLSLGVGSGLSRVWLGFGSGRLGERCTVYSVQCTVYGVKCKVYEKTILLQRHYSAIGRIYPRGSGYGRLWDPAVRLDQEASFQPIEVLDAKLFEWRRDSVFFRICGVRSYQRPVKKAKNSEFEQNGGDYLVASVFCCTFAPDFKKRSLTLWKSF